MKLYVDEIELASKTIERCYKKLDFKIKLNEMDDEEFEKINVYIGYKNGGYDIIYTPINEIRIKRLINSSDHSMIFNYNIDNRKESIELAGDYIITKNNIINMKGIINIREENKTYLCSLSNGSILRLEEDEYYSIRWFIKKHFEIEN